MAKPAGLPDLLTPITQELLGELQVSIEARLGQSRLTVSELMAVRAGSVLTLDQSIADHVDLYLNGALIARGEIVAVDDRFGVRIVDIAE